MSDSAKNVRASYQGRQNGGTPNDNSVNTATGSDNTATGTDSYNVDNMDLTLNSNNHPVSTPTILTHRLPVLLRY
jgi:hypothetical protein